MKEVIKRDSNTSKRKWPVPIALGRTIVLSVILILITAAIFFYNNFNRLLSEALLKSFNTSIVSDVYELKFEKLRVNVLNGSIQVLNVTLMPREKPLHVYPYINSSFRLKTDRISLENVEIGTLLKSNRLALKNISITKPEVELLLTGAKNIMLPFKDSTAINLDKKDTKELFDSFLLREFQLIDASFHVKNAGKQREFWIKNFNISLYSLLVEQHPGEYQIGRAHV